MFDLVHTNAIDNAMFFREYVCKHNSSAAVNVRPCSIIANQLWHSNSKHENNSKFELPVSVRNTNEPRDIFYN